MDQLQKVSNYVFKIRTGKDAYNNVYNIAYGVL